MSINLGTEMTKTATSLAIIPKGNRRHVAEDDSTTDVAEQTDLTVCRDEMRQAFADFKNHAVSAVEAGVRLGDAARKVKEALAHGEFGPWLEKNVKGVSEQWARACMRASAVLELAGKKREFKPLIAQANTVEKLAALKRTIEGKAPIEAPKRKVGKRAAEDRTIEGETRVVPEPGAEEMKQTLIAKAHELAEKLDAVEKREAECARREAECDRREKALTLAARPMDEGEAAPDLAAARAAARKPKKTTEGMVAAAVAKATKPKAPAKGKTKPKKADSSPGEAAGSAPDDEGAATPLETTNAAPSQDAETAEGAY